MRKDPRKTLLGRSASLCTKMVYKTGIPGKFHPRRMESYEIGQEHVAAAPPPGRWSVRRQDPACPKSSWCSRSNVIDFAVYLIEFWTYGSRRRLADNTRLVSVAALGRSLGGLGNINFRPVLPCDFGVHVVTVTRACELEEGTLVHSEPCRPVLARSWPSGTTVSSRNSF